MMITQSFRRACTLLLSMLLLAVLVACSPAEQSASEGVGQDATDEPTTEVSTPGSPADDTIDNPLAGTNWALVTMGGEEVQEGMTLDFSADTISGSDGCNTFTGGYTIENGALVLADNFASTARSCPDKDEEMSRQYLDALLTAGDFTLDGDSLTLRTEMGDLLFAPATDDVATESTPEVATSTPEAVGDSSGQPHSEAAYADVFFMVVEEEAPHTVIVGTGDLTLADGQLSGTLTAYADSEDFASDTGTISGTYQEGPPQGDKQSYTADMQISFDNAPGYTASGSFYTVAGKLFTEQPMVLSKDGVRVGKFILAEDDGGN